MYSSSQLYKLDLRFLTVFKAFSSGQVWDSETGKLIRTQAGHKGWVTDIFYSIATRHLFSGSVDGTLVAWNEKGKEVQVVEYGGPVFCLSWNQKRKHLIAAGNGVVHMYKVQAQARSSPAFGTSEQQLKEQVEQLASLGVILKKLENLYDS